MFRAGMSSAVSTGILLIISLEVPWWISCWIFFLKFLEGFLHKLFYWFLQESFRDSSRQSFWDFYRIFFLPSTRKLSRDFPGKLWEISLELLEIFFYIISRSSMKFFFGNSIRIFFSKSFREFINIFGNYFMDFCSNSSWDHSSNSSRHFSRNFWENSVCKDIPLHS